MPGLSERQHAAAGHGLLGSIDMSDDGQGLHGARVCALHFSPGLLELAAQFVTFPFQPVQPPQLRGRGVESPSRRRHNDDGEADARAMRESGRR